MKKILFILATLLFQLSSFAQYTAIPDANFEYALKILGLDSGPIDHKVLTANINTITYLPVNSCTIADLTGIQDFVALTGLDCFDNQLTSLNVSGLTALNSLDCDANQLTSLNVSGCTALTFLNCTDNQLTSLNLSGLTTLNTLYCYTNQLMSLSVSGLTALTTLRCYTNQLTSLNLSGLTALAYFDCTSNPPLSCIQVDNTAAATANSGWFKGATASYSVNCGLATNSYEFTNGVVVFPNPTQAVLTLSTTTALDKIIITDLTGKTVLQQTLPSNQVNVQHLAKGMYMLQAYSGKEKYTTKFVKE